MLRRRPGGVCWFWGMRFGEGEGEGIYLCLVDGLGGEEGGEEEEGEGFEGGGMHCCYERF